MWPRTFDPRWVPGLCVCSTIDESAKACSIIIRCCAKYSWSTGSTSFRIMLFGFLKNKKDSRHLSYCGRCKGEIDSGANRLMLKVSIRTARGYQAVTNSGYRQPIEGRTHLFMKCATKLCTFAIIVLSFCCILTRQNWPRCPRTR